MFKPTIQFYSHFTTPLKKIEESLLALSRLDATALVGEKYIKIKLYAERLHGSLLNDAADNAFFVYDKQIIGLTDVSLVDKFLANASDQSLADQTLNHLLVLSGATDNVVGLESFDTRTLSDILSGKKKEYDSAAFFYTLRQAIGVGAHHDDALTILAYLEAAPETKELSTNEVVALVLMLNVVWKELINLSDEQQSFLLRQCFYVSIVVGVPVREILKTALYLTSDPLEYLLLNTRLFDFLKLNAENILTKADGSMALPLSKLVLNYGVEAAATAEDTKQQKQFAERIYQGQSGVDFFSSWLAEILSIYFGLQEAHLAPSNIGGEVTDADRYERELAQLILNFFDKEAWLKIVAYYKHDKPFVPLRNLFAQFKSNIDLGKENAVPRLAAFAEFLHDNGLLSPNQELVEFHESDSQFHWNEKLIV